MGALRNTILAVVRRDGPDLSARHLGLFLTLYLTAGPHTVAGLAAEVGITKSSITRALDKLEELDLARRKLWPRDRRVVMVQRTPKGVAMLRRVEATMAGSMAGAPPSA
ncbi:MarR family transcriptional regulator [Roseicella aerolata]|uniref:MarR family transcriptional regulator n=1 Tax=Roseicella aerolata TaxID=2883479 RepID=A0A9X1IJP0_9PROT|nr:MarR family transcriptional regulator [Roseicella aerolata]MCB4824285.1 MarR family transcriptional regulator [Roseicella aerolata]